MNTYHVYKENHQVLVSWLPGIYHISDLNTHISNFRIKEYKHILADSREEMFEIEKEMQTLKYEALIDKKAFDTILQDEYPNEFKIISKKIEKYFIINDSMMKYSMINGDQKAKEFILQSKPIYDSLTMMISKVVEKSSITGQELGYHSDTSFKKSLYLVLVLSVIFMILVILFTNFISNKIVQPLRLLENATIRFKNGEYDFRIQILNSDEFGNLAETFNEMANKISKTIYELNDLNVNLEEKVQNKTKDLEILNSKLLLEIEEKDQAQLVIYRTAQQLEELNKTKDKFFSIIAHDLKNPFSTLLGFSELLKLNLNKYDINKLEHFINIIHSSSRQGYNLLENLLEWSRSQTGSISFKPELANVGSLIKEAYGVVENSAKIKEIAIEITTIGELTAYCDKNMIITVIRNILTNAIKFTHKGGNVKISATEDENKITLSIQDSGIGIPLENLVNIFNIESKFSTRGTDNETGTGLGLILCKEFIIKNNGTIWIESVYGQGTVIYFNLPKIVKFQTNT